MKKKRITILGAKESGTGAAVLAQKQGYEVFVSDNGQIRDEYKSLLNQYTISWEEQQHSIETIMKSEEVVISPGIPYALPMIKEIQQKGIPVIGEVEFASRFTSATIIGVTGSNGKTTTTNLIYEMFKLAGTNTGMAGNVGKSFAWQVAHYAHESYVLELSSFQLEGIQDFKPDVAIILNITPDHLDRYNYNLSEYVEAKFAIAANMRKEDKLICCADDPVIMDRLAKHPVNPETFYFSVEKKRGQTAYINNDQLIIKTSKNSFAMNIDDLSLKGTHNTYNSMAAGITGRLYELRKETIRESLSSFAGVEHRLEKFLKIRDVQFINDSKATNINSTWYALESVSENVVWISGGIDKGNDYEMLRELVRKKVKAIVCLGKDNSKIHEAFEREDIPLVDAGSMEEAVQQSFKLAGKGDTVLLSPACASFDLFDNYEDRGNQFKQCVRSL